MSFKLFKKNPSADGKKKEIKTLEKEKSVGLEEVKNSPTLPVTGLPAGQAGNSETYKVLRNLYVSEKASLLNGFNQYVFRVFNNANKSQVKKQVERLFNVKVKGVKVLNMPKKRRDLGRHPGFKSEFKKVIVVLEKGQTIEQAKP